MALSAQILGPLVDDDLTEIANVPKNSKAPTLKRLSERHHRLARSLAEGMAPGDAAIANGYNNARVSVLLDDPSFQELVAYYRRQVNAAFVDFQEKLADLASLSADILQDRLEDNPDDVDLQDIIKVLQLSADRTGHGPSSSTNVNLSGFGERLAAARKRRESNSLITDAEIVSDDGQE